MTWATTGFALDIKSVIFIFLILGLLLHWRPIAYVRAVNNAASITGPLMLQYPLYGGIMGLMTGTGLAGVIAQGFVAFSTAATLPFWSYIASVIISLFVPSGGGHWAVQGPFVVPAAVHLHASQAASSMGVAMGEEVANMIQPFWALPIIAIAGISIRRVMGFTVISFVALALWRFALALGALALRSNHQHGWKGCRHSEGRRACALVLRQYFGGLQPGFEDAGYSTAPLFGFNYERGRELPIFN